MTSSNDYLFILGNYQLTQVLGVGAMGYVYRARQTNLERDVAVKILAPKLAQETGYVDLFIREARTAASLEHPHIVPVFDYGVQHEISYVAMRLLLGGSLGERIQHRLDRNQPLPSLADIASILTQAANALDYAHARGVIHRDIKPTNLMFDQHGGVYIVDFGIAKLVGTTGSFNGGQFLGTPSFMAPEQWEGLVPSPAIDQYALGAVIYMLVTGHPPFEADAALALMNKHLRDIPRDVRDYRPNAPAQINEVLRKALAKQPEDRFPNATAFAQAFAAAVLDGMAASEAPTEFTTYPLPQSSFSLPLPMVTKQPTLPPTAEVEPAAEAVTLTHDSFGRGRTIILWIESALLVLAIALIVVLVALLVSQQTHPDAPTPTTVLVLAATQGGSLTPTEVPVSMTAALENVSPLQAGLTFTPTLLPTMTATFLPTMTATIPPTMTATVLPTLPPTVIATDVPVLPTDRPMDTATFTAAASEIPSATATEIATATETATATATATFSARPNVPWHNGSHLRVNNTNGAWLRARASTRAAQVATVAYNNLVTATGRNYFDGRQWWWEVTASWGAVGWVEQYSLVEQ